MRWTTVFAALVALLACQPGRAHAADDSPPPFRGSLLGGFAFGAPAPELWQLAVGATVGVTFPVPVYVGLTSTYHFGASENEPGVPRHHLHYHTASVGYAFVAENVTITPQALIGLAVVRTVRDVDGGFTSPCGGPAVDFDIAVSRQLFVASSLRYVLVTRAVNNGDNAYVTAGLGLYVGAGLRL